jgi:hypothetical protein
MKKCRYHVDHKPWVIWSACGIGMPWFKYIITYGQYPHKGWGARKAAKRIIEMESQRNMRPEFFIALPEGKIPRCPAPRRIRHRGRA